MRGLLCKFKIEQEKARSRVATLFAKWRVLLYSAPVLALFAPGTVFAKASKALDPTKPGIAKTLIGKGGDAGVALLGAAVSGAGSIVAAGVETLGSLLVWLFILFHVSKIFADLFSGIFLFLINFLIGVSQYNSFLGANIVTIGWTVTRDIANMFLVVALLVIAFATILNINSYQASSLLKEFFFAAILVNFSKMICGLFIDAAQVVMMTFVSGYAETAAGNFIRLFKVADWLQLALGTAKDQTTGQGVGVSTLGAQAIVTGGEAVGFVAKASADFFTGITSNVLTAIIAFIGVLAVLSLDIILVVRIVTIWFLIVASPIAFVAKVLPVTKGFASQWWGAFMKQLIAGPLVAFIVWISLASIAVSDTAFDVTKEARQSSAQLFAEASATQTSQGQLAATKISQWENLAHYFIPIVIFIMGAKWAVGVAGGAAKSITGFANKKLGGYARSGLSAFKKQAIGKGQFSVMSQAKKGFTGEGGFTTGLVGGVVGGSVGWASNKFKPGSGDTFNRRAGRFLGGASGRAHTKELHDDVKNFGSKFGLGELGKKRHDVVNADAEAKMYRMRGSEQLAKDNAAAARLPPAEKKKAEEEAQSRYAVLMKKADEVIHHAEAAQADIFKADGLTDDGALLAAMKKKVEGGNASEVELHAAKKMITESADKKVTAKIAEERQKWAAARKTFTDGGGDANDFRKFDESAVRGDAENEFGIKKKNPDDPANPGIEDLYARYKESPPLRIFKDTNKTPTKVAEEAVKDNAKTASEGLSAIHIKATSNYSTSMKNVGTGAGGTAAAPAEAAAARSALAAAMGGALTTHADKADDKTLKAAVQRAINLVPAAERPAFTAQLATAAGGNARVTTVINEIRTTTIKVPDVQDEIETRYNKRREEKPEGSLQMTIKDVGAQSDKGTGQMFMPPEAVAKLEALIRQDPSFIARLGPEVVGQADIKRMIGHVLTSSTHGVSINTRLRREGVDRKIASQIRKQVAEAIRTSNPEPAMKTYADTFEAMK